MLIIDSPPVIPVTDPLILSALRRRHSRGHRRALVPRPRAAAGERAAPAGERQRARCRHQPRRRWVRLRLQGTATATAATRSAATPKPRQATGAAGRPRSRSPEEHRLADSPLPVAGQRSVALIPLPPSNPTVPDRTSSRSTPSMAMGGTGTWLIEGCWCVEPFSPVPKSTSCIFSPGRRPVYDDLDGPVGRLDHPLGDLGDADRFAHVEHEHLAVLSDRAGLDRPARRPLRPS